MMQFGFQPFSPPLQSEAAGLGFVLVDCDHSREGVRRDIDALMAWRPTIPLFIVMHDSFNPECRAGLRTANWSANGYVEYVELDFVAGSVSPTPQFRGELWGGLAVAKLAATPRPGPLEIVARAEMTFARAYRQPSQPSIATRVLRKAARVIKRDV
jgi:hypothetical protein